MDVRTPNIHAWNRHFDGIDPGLAIVGVRDDVSEERWKALLSSLVSGLGIREIAVLAGVNAGLRQHIEKMHRTTEDNFLVVTDSEDESSLRHSVRPRLGRVSILLPLSDEILPAFVRDSRTPLHIVFVSPKVRDVQRVDRSHMDIGDVLDFSNLEGVFHNGNAEPA